MRHIEKIVNDIIRIYYESGKDAGKYLYKARKLREKFNSGLAIVYCWFYSIPQKWIFIEPKIFELARYTKFFDLNLLLDISPEQIAYILKPVIFYNRIAIQFKNFCEAVKEEYCSWDNLANRLAWESIFVIFEKLRTYRGVRITYKNLAAMKIIVGNDDDLLILDTHVAKVLGIGGSEINKYRTQKMLFEKLLNYSRRITDRLRNKGLRKITTSRWSLAIWFNKTKTSADDLLTQITFRAQYCEC